MPVTTPLSSGQRRIRPWNTRSIGPLVFVVGGLGPSGDILLVPLRTEVTGRITWQRTPRTERAAIGDRAGLPGAACLAWDAL